MRGTPALLALLLLPAVVGLPTPAGGYPLDGHERTGIRRLWAYSPERGDALPRPALPPGALLSITDVRLRLTDRPEYDLDGSTPRDERLQRGLDAIFADRDPNYSIAVLDVSDPASPRYAARHEGRTYLPGSVGKTLVAVGLFDALARAFPDPGVRLRVLRETSVVADEFIRSDSHSVPVVDMQEPSLVHRPIRVGDTFSLFEWLDHMLSPSANAAASTTWKQAMLLRRFGDRYPPSPRQEEEFLSGTPPQELARLSLAALEDPLEEAGLDTGRLRQGTMFTDAAARRVPGTRSYASPLQLLRLLVRLEQGRLVDDWSSLELKRSLYFTRRRYRYAVSPALDRAAVYFKSGSFYRCVPEPGFECRQYAGNDTNIMNSIAIVESPARPEPGERQRVYLVALMSNVLRRNAAEDHRDIATEIDRLVAATQREAADAAP